MGIVVLWKIANIGFFVGILISMVMKESFEVHLTIIQVQIIIIYLVRRIYRKIMKILYEDEILGGKKQSPKRCVVFVVRIDHELEVI